MKKVLLLAFLLGMLPKLSAIAVAWYIPHSAYEWADGLTSADISIVYSQNAFGSFQDVAASESKVNFPSGSAQLSPRIPSPGEALPNVPLTFTATTEGTFAEAFGGLVPSVGSPLYLYMVVKNPDKSGDYLVSKAVEYTGGNNHGITEAKAQPGDLDLNFYYDPIVWGGVGKMSTPEPTVLALLALGVAGFVLRRKA